MSLSLSSPPPPPPPPPSPSSPPFPSLGYILALALSVLVLLSSLLLASYLCLRRHRRPTPSPPTLPRIIFVAESESDSDLPTVGLNAAVINSYPRFPYNKTQRGGDNNNNAMCAICLCEYREGEMMRMLPDCRHAFHLGCVDAWLRLNASCPVCRTSPLPTPLSTPLSELVPLSHYSNGTRQR